MLSGSKEKLIKKLYIFNYEFPPLGGGGGKASYFIAREMVKKGCKVKVITSRFKGLLGREFIEGVEICRIPVVRRHIHRATVFEMITYIGASIVYGLIEAKRDRPDVSLAFFGIPSGPAAFFLKIVFGIPYCVSLRGGDVPGFSPQELGLYHLITRPVIHFIWRNASVVIANSKGLRDLAVKSMKNLEVKIISNGIDPELFKEQESKKKNSGNFKILFAGRFTHQKGVDVLLRSLLIASDKVSGTEVLLVGDGPEKKRLESLAKEIGSRFEVRFYGWQDKHILYRMYREADVVVLPSRDEGMPNVVLEAMAAGVPVIATRVPGSEDLVENEINGIIVEKDDPRGLAHALVKLIQDPAVRSHMGEAGRKIAERYDWTVVAGQYFGVMEGILGNLNSDG